MAFDRAAMDAAGAQALADLDKLISDMTPEEVAGAKKLVGWVKTNYKSAGYKRLCRPLVYGKVKGLDGGGED